MSLPKSYKVLTPYERANLYSCLEISAASLKSGIQDQNLAVINGALAEIKQRVKTLERAAVAQALFNTMPKKFRAKPIRQLNYKFGVSLLAGVAQNGVKDSGKLFLMAGTTGVRCAVALADIEIVND